ncbi:Odorant receptor coreceptor [Nesidiocoris tenuis]|uniref:S-methyl-5'-thioadenosine phosphorylase n=1 Tax=Nesidiocoris tenuis TaxID=355587 RepID=A0ABN7AAG6_9HEMI|nr:Odorant receptor coreceptor [Nesidiocoris tenuis]
MDGNKRLLHGIVVKFLKIKLSKAATSTAIGKNLPCLPHHQLSNSQRRLNSTVKNTCLSAMPKVKIGIIGGSGLNNPELLKNGVEKTVDTQFGQPSDVLIEGQIQGVDVVLLARHGRHHTINPTNVNYRANIWALKTLGCTHVIVSAAVGSLKEEIKPGQFVVPDSFIDRTTKRIQTFYDGSPNGLPGVCHIPMEPAFCPTTRKILLETAQELGLTVHPKGNLVVIEGPRFSSKAESNMYRSIGGSIIGMTLVPEVVLAKEAGLCYACVAMATDYDCWFDHVVDVPSVLATFKQNVDNIIKLFVNVIPRIAEQDWTDILANNELTVKNGIQSEQVKK